MADLVPHIGQALLMAAGMFWQVGWSLVLGFSISAILQAVVSKESMTAALGRDGVREIALATAAGAASSSCSYASAAVSRTLFKKGAALIPSLAFMFASTNLVAELGIILYLLMGWQFMAGEWIGGVALVVILSCLVRLTYPKKLVEEARHYPEARSGHEHGDMTAEGSTVWAKLLRRETWVLVAQNFAMDWSMLWKDLLLGFLIAGALSVFVPDGVWQALFVKGASPWVQVPANALLAPIVAVLSFVCSIGNVPMAAVLWGSGVSFGGVLAFPIRRPDRAAAARRLPALLRVEDGRLHRRRVLRDDCNCRANHGRGVLCHRLDSSEPAGHACRDGPLFNELYFSGSTLPSACLPSRCSQSSAAIRRSTGMANIMRSKGNCATSKGATNVRRFTRTAPCLRRPSAGLALFAEKRGEGGAGFIRSHGDGK